MITETITKKLGFDQTQMDNARARLHLSQMVLNNQLDSILEVPVPRTEREFFDVESWEFRTSQWTEISGLVKGLLEENRVQVGHAKTIMFPIEMDGFDVIVGYMKAGLNFKTITLPVARMLIIIHGVLEVISGTEKVMKEVAMSRQNSSNQFFTGSRLYIEAGERVEYLTAHNVIFITKLYPSNPPPSMI